MLTKYLKIALLFLFCNYYAQAQTLDDFTDGDFTVNPSWSGNSADYIVIGNQLRSNSTIASSSFYLSTPSSVATNSQWEFWCNLQFNTSSLNYVDVYLVADQANLMSPSLNGYFVRIGNTLDEVCLYRNNAGTVTKIIDGADGTTNQSNTILKVKVVRDVSNQFTLYTDFSATGSSYALEGSIIDNSFLTSSAFGVVTKQSTSTFFQKHFFDDFYVGAIILDTTPPQPVSVAITSATTLDLTFNENVEFTSSQTAANYSVNNGVGIASNATRDLAALNIVHLTFSVPFSNGVANTLTVNNVQDSSGNPITAAPTLNFTYYNLSAPLFKDVIINEIMADANPSIGSIPVTEWVEIYNNSATKTFDLAAWTFSDGVTTGTAGSKYLLPGQHMILCKHADTALLSPFGLVCGLSAMPSLNDGGDNIFLEDNVGNVIDSVSYDISWYNDNSKSGGGWTLELINPNNPSTCIASGNWSATMNVNGGTPGQQNSIYSVAPDVIGPVPVQVTVTDSTHITVCFNEAINASQISIAGNYSVNNGIGNPASAVANGTTMKCVDLVLAAPLQNSTNYLLSFSALSDCSGNSVSPSSISFSFYVPAYNDVVISEIMADPDPPVGLPNYEYIELYNRTSFTISLKNYTVGTSTSVKTIPDIVIHPDSFVVLTGSAGFSGYAGYNLPVYEVVSFPSLTNSGGTLTLKNQNGKIINSITYSDAWYADVNKEEGGFSLEMIDPLNPCGEQNNWKASNSITGGTPGKTNSVNASNPDNVAPILKRISVLSSDTIQLFFNEKIDSVNMMQTNLYSVDNGIGSPAAAIAVANDFKSVKLIIPVPLQAGIIYTCTVATTIKDCAGNVIAVPYNSSRFALPEPAGAGDIVINEILFDPESGGVDFLELYNKSSKTIDLGQLNIGEQDTIAGILNDLQIINEDGFLFFPGEYIVLSESGTIVKSHYYTTAPNNFLDMTSLPAMNSGGDVVVLSDQSGNIIDKVVYTEDMHFDLLNDTKGVSLERIDFNRSSDDKTNWNSAASTVGFATPGYRNSQYLVAVEDAEVKVSPETFSPDNDGYEDVLNISYNLEGPGQIANVTIFDASGRLVRRLVKSETLGQKGTMSWNGLTDANEKAPIGIYVIYFESLETSGKVHKFKRSCVLAGKL